MNHVSRAVAVIGANVRRLRTDEGMSLSALARRSGVAKATLSALEGGTGNPTVATLEALSGTLRAPLSELIGEQERHLSRVVRGSGATESGTDDVLIEAFVPRGVVELYDFRYEPGTRIDYDAHEHGVCERILVYDGVLRAGPTQGPTTLHPGDFLAFDADCRHLVEAREGPARGVLLMSYPAAAPSESPIHARSRRGDG